MGPLTDAARIAFGVGVYAYFMWVGVYTFGFATNAQTYIAYLIETHFRHPALLRFVEGACSLGPNTVRGSARLRLCKHQIGQTGTVKLITHVFAPAYLPFTLH